MTNKIILLLACFVYSPIYAMPTVTDEHHKSFELSIVHINDFHARFVQTSKASSTCHKSKENECIGGFGRLMTVTRQLMNERPNAIFLNAGDQYQGSLWYNLFKWNVTAYFMNKLPHDAIAIGNHELDGGVANLVPFLKRVRAPFVAANVDASEEPTMQGLYKNSTVIVRNNQTIGVIGLLGQETKLIAKIGKLKLLDEVETVNLEAERLKAKGVKIIIVLSHIGLDLDKIIAANCPEVDVIVGGHSHTFLASDKLKFMDRPSDNYPVVVEQNTSTNRTVLIVHAGSYNKYVGNLSVWFDQQGEVINWEGAPIFLNSSIEQDPETMKELQPWAKTVDLVSNRVVGSTRSYLEMKPCHWQECALGNLMADAMVHYYKNQTDNSEHWTYAAISCRNSGGIRSNIPSGNIIYGDLVAVMPFENIWNVVELRGDDLLLAIEEPVAKSAKKDYYLSDALLHWSGINVTYNFSMPAWSRAQELSVRCQACKQPKFEPLDREKWYRVIVPEYELRGGNGLTTIATKHRNLQPGPRDIDAFTKFIHDISPFDYKVDNRMRVVGKWSG